MLKDKATSIHTIAKHLNIKDYNLDEVMANTSIDNARQRRKEKMEKAGEPFFEQILYRSGKANSWQECLSNDVLELYESSL